jgi:hypothetical protein
MKKFMVISLLAFFSAQLCGPSTLRAIDYTTDIKPLLAEKCAACHGSLRQEAGLRLDHGRLLRQGGDAGSIIAKDQLGQIELLLRVSTSDLSLRMPPEGEGEPLNTEQLAVLAGWLSAGAPSPDDEPVPDPPDKHWAWQAPQQAPLPIVDAAEWSSHPVDRFIADRLSSAGLQPAPLADPRTRLRRLFFDLTGLPPTLDEQRSYLQDMSPAGWNRLVDRLLDDPAHGERWARHWMDVWRYSDWDGYKQELRSSQRHIWRWRDWIVQSLNEDRGYDRMLVEMLAADEIAPLDRDALRATGFLARNYHKSNRDIWLDATVEHTAKAFLGLTLSCARCHDHKYDPINQQEYYAFRAIFEPHQVRTERMPGQPDVLKDGLVRAYDAKLDEPTYLYIAGNEKSPDREHPIAPAVPSMISLPFEVAPVELPATAVFPSLAKFIQEEDLAAAEQRLNRAEQELAKAEQTKGSDQNSPTYRLAEQTVVARRAELKSLRARWQADLARYATPSTPPALNWEKLKGDALSAEYEAKLEEARRLVAEKKMNLSLALLSSLSGAADTREKVKTSHKAFEEARHALQKTENQPNQIAQDVTADENDGQEIAGNYTSVGTVYPTHSTGRRSALARWITDRRNPLTARVAINHLWLHYFGQPLVENVFDFGLRSPPPAHQALLDWLAVELMENQWSLKHIQRLIVTSRAYQLSSHVANWPGTERNRAIDPDNRLLWRGSVRRLDAEVIRDSLLAVGGKLDRTQGGPEIDFELGEKQPRRSLYFRHAYEKQMTMLVLFDAAGPQECYRRSESIIPQQALALSNSPLSIDQSRHLAQRLWELAIERTDTVETANTTALGTNQQTNRPETAFVQAAFETLLGRPGSEHELQACLAFLTTQSQLLQSPANLHLLPGEQVGQTQAAADPTARARENLIHTLLNHNDFVSLR